MLSRLKKPESFNVERERYILESMDSALNHLAGPAYRIIIKDALHQSFSDETFFQGENLEAKLRTLQLVLDLLAEFAKAVATGAANHFTEDRVRARESIASFESYGP